MNRISRRASAILLLVIALLSGLVFFLCEYVADAEKWILSTGSPHVFNSSNIGCGQILDSSGELLLDLTNSRVYSEDPALRMATLHWLGDRQGRISAPAIAHYGKEMTGYDRVNGLYSYNGIQGQAELTLSSDVQTAALKALGDRKGTVGIYNYKTGEILCAVTSPSYDPDNVPDIEKDDTGRYEGVYMNRFVQNTYPPGSIFKIVTTAAALDCVDGILDMKFTCAGEYAYGIDRVTCEKAHGTLNLKDALAKSCNCCFTQIANLVGKENLEDYANQFLITEPVRFDGVTTARGKFDLAKAAPVQIGWAGIGQYTDMINPCRYMTFMGMIAGGGVTAKPYLVKQVSLGDEITYKADIISSERIMSQELAQTLTDYMRNNVETVYGAENFPGLIVCAKSGTSELGGDLTPNAMFAGFVADEAYPLAFIVVVENGGYGSATCVPILKDVLAVCKSVLDRKS